MTNGFEQTNDEPLFTSTSQKDQRMLDAYRMASESMGRFKELVRSGSPGVKYAKLRFRDPDLSEQLGEDRFLYLWLSEVYFHEAEGIFSGVFFEVPPEFQKWHQVGQRLGFDSEDVFDWMINDGGHLVGGFTLRVSRDYLPEEERSAFDRYVGVETYEPL
jgi:uncharacterized protein YegJ (DUF2314 family)